MLQHNKIKYLHVLKKAAIYKQASVHISAMLHEALIFSDKVIPYGLRFINVAHEYYLFGFIVLAQLCARLHTESWNVCCEHFLGKGKKGNDVKNTA